MRDDQGKWRVGQQRTPRFLDSPLQFRARTCILAFHGGCSPVIPVGLRPARQSTARVVYMSLYSRVLESALLPAYYSLRGRGYPKHREFLERSQWWSREQIDEFQWRELRHLLDHAFRTVPYYRDKYAATGIELGDIRYREDFARLPCLTREEINVHRQELCSTQWTGELLPHATGGSSGVPTSFFITYDSYDWRRASTSRAYSWAGYREGERVLHLWGAPVGHLPPFKRTKLTAYRFLRRELVQVTFSQTTELWRETLHRALRFRPKYIVGYVASIEQFAKYLVAERSPLPGIQSVIAAAEPVFDHTRRLVREAFSAPLFNTYGCREFMSIAAECDERKGLHVNAENLFVETELGSDQGPSEILITDLHNYGMPFIRYRIGDVGSLSDSNCPCGRGLPLIGSLGGRILEVLRTRDGRVVPGEFFSHMLKDFSEILEFQVQQTSLDEILILLVLRQPLRHDRHGTIRQQSASVFGNNIRIAIREVDSIPRRPSGKRIVTLGLGSPLNPNCAPAELGQ